jgi:hypothetical protein
MRGRGNESSEALLIGGLENRFRLVGDLSAPVVVRLIVIGIEAKLVVESIQVQFVGGLVA